jgi:hypothetical protein
MEKRSVDQLVGHLVDGMGRRKGQKRVFQWGIHSVEQMGWSLGLRSVGSMVYSLERQSVERKDHLLVDSKGIGREFHWVDWWEEKLEAQMVVVMEQRRVETREMTMVNYLAERLVDLDLRKVVWKERHWEEKMVLSRGKQSVGPRELPMDEQRVVMMGSKSVDWRGTPSVH